MANTIVPDKRYLIFDFYYYDTGGGLENKSESYDTLDECLEYLKKYKLTKNGEYCGEIYDRIKGIEIVYTDDYQIINE